MNSRIRVRCWNSRFKLIEVKLKELSLGLRKRTRRWFVWCMVRSVRVSFAAGSDFWHDGGNGQKSPGRRLSEGEEGLIFNEGFRLFACESLRGWTLGSQT